MDKYDFSGYATRANLKCSDGRIIMKDAFKGDDGKQVPLVWNHRHGDVSEVLGHAVLENREDGVYAYCTFNDTENGKIGEALVEHGDVNALSICANKLKQVGSQVMHGIIREVSLVLAGANPGAYIENVMAHSDEDGDEAIIYTGETISLYHADGEDSGINIKEVCNAMTDDQKKTVKALVGLILSGDNTTVEHAEESSEGSTSSENRTVQDVIDSMNEEQQRVFYAAVGSAALAGNEADEENNETTGGSEEMKQNVFDTQSNGEIGGVLMHSDGTAVEFEEIGQIFRDAKRYGSLKESVLNHGIDQVDYLFPDDKNLTNVPTFIQRDQAWVREIMNGVHHTPFSKVKSMFADITEDDARAKGYIKGKMKKEEFFSLLKRSTGPTTVYKKQKMDRDDIIDITDFDIVAWLKTEMRMMLDEELARAILIGDGRLASSDDKIDENCIRPIAKDADLFTVHVDVTVASSATDDDKAKEFIRTVIKTRKLYKGSGNPILFTTEDMLTDMLLLTDEMGRDLYADEAALARKLRARKIVTVPVMEGVNGKNGNPLVGVMLNLNDYNVGADRGGSVNMFDDFDIDYNAQKYLIETRCSGALTVPYSAMAFEMKTQG